MTIATFLEQATARLGQAKISTARLDCLVLLEDVLGRDRAHLLAHTDAIIPLTTEVYLNNKIVQRASHMPLAYIRGKVSFYGREFIVTPNVLVPRPETETMIGMVKALPSKNVPVWFLDIGAGSGCVGITAGLEIKNSKIELSDISQNTLDVAAKNAQVHNITARYRHADLLSRPFIHRYDVFLANLPYVPDAHPINEAARHEPPLALFGGSDGLVLYRRFWQQVHIIPAMYKPTHILTESLPTQHDEIALLARRAGYQLEKREGLIQQFARIDKD